MIGCCVAWKCARAWRFFDESQQPTWPHSRHMRKCSHVSPNFRHSSQPFVFGFTPFLIVPMCVHCVAISDLQTPNALFSTPYSLPYFAHPNPSVTLPVLIVRFTVHVPKSISATSLLPAHETYAALPSGRTRTSCGLLPTSTACANVIVLRSITSTLFWSGSATSSQRPSLV